MELHKKPIDDQTILNLQSVIYFLVIVVVALLFFIYQLFTNSEQLFPWPKKQNFISESVATSVDNNTGKPKEDFWKAPSVATLEGKAEESQILYGKDLIQNTAKYLGPKGSVAKISNGMNCQNCHLDAGTKTFGNNYGSVAATYPKFRARSGTEENIYKRVNDCFERSLNGIALDTASAEMLAIKAYIEFLGNNVPKGETAKGSGLKDIPFMNRPADADKGKQVYVAKCAVCHGADGEGIKAADGIVYTYPPMWGKHSYNDGAGLYRISNFAKYVKYNMPLGATYESPQLTDDEAWDLAAFVNSQSRPHKDAPKDWPDISKKPIDHPFGPYADGFDETQHKYGPYKPIVEARKQKK